MGRRLLAAVVLALAVFAVVFAGASSAAGSGTTYSQEQTLAVPPASSFQGSAGGDGWGITLSNTQVFNVFHHNGQMLVNCRNQSNASLCWASDPQVVRDAQGYNFQTSGQPDTRYDAATGHLYVYGTSTHDWSAGVVCFDTNAAAAGQNPFCGYTELTGANEAYSFGWSAVGSPMQVGSKWYAFNFYPGQGHVGAKNALLCFDLGAASACAGQPYTVAFTGTMNTSAPSPTGLAEGTRLYMPLNTSGANVVACYDTATAGNCAGTWPAPSPAPTGSFGGPVPKLTPTGTPAGFCLPYGVGYCFDESGAWTTAPVGFSGQTNGSVNWNGPGLALGTRAYIPHWSNQVGCWDWSTNAACPSFPKSFANLGLLYTVNPDPQRPTCLWVNADNGGAQIQSFDAYTGGACGAGSSRVLTSQFIVPQQQCYPTAYQSLAVTSPTRSSYTSGTVAFADAGGNAIAGVSPVSLDANGVADLTGLNLNGGNGLPQFIITLTGANTTQLSVKLTWTADYDPACVTSGQVVTKAATTLSTSLSSGDASGTAITVAQGATVSDQASVAGDNAAKASGTVQYRWYSDSTCSTLAADSGALSIGTPGSLPSSSVTLNDAGTYYAVASYSGDAGNEASQGQCGDETVTVKDLTPPTVHVPADRKAEATGPHGAAVDFSVTASDNLDPSPSVSCSAASGDTFPLGTTQVTCTATDASGNQSDPASFAITVQDTTPPAITIPADKTVEGTGRGGATASWTASATDLVDGAVAVTCTPASGSSFGYGTTTVTCSATDAHGNSASKSFTVTVQDTTPPTITAAATTAPDGYGWYAGDVTVHFTCSDSGSGIPAGTCPADQVLTGEGAAVSSTAETVTDAAGNTSAPSNVVTVKIDRTDPTVSFSPNGGVYDVDQTVAIDCSATDALSGIASSTCHDVNAAAWTLGLGIHNLAASAKDKAGNTGSATGSFTVVVTGDGLCSLVQRWIANDGVANSLCAKLRAAAASRARGQDKAADNQLAAFRKELDAQSGKKLTAAHAETLAQLSRSL